MTKVNFPFAHKLALSMVILIVSGMMLLGGLIIRDQHKLLEKQMHSYARILINQLSASATDSYLTSNTLDMDVLVNNLSQNTEIMGITFYSEEKKLLTSTGPVPSSPEFPGTNQEMSAQHWKMNLPESEASSPQVSQKALKSYLSYIGTVVYKDVVIGYVLLTFDQAILTQARAKTMYTIILTTIILIILTILSAFILGKRLSRPIEELVDVSEAISLGNYEVRFDERRNDEFGVLMHSMNIMAEGLLHKKSVENAFSRYVSPKIADEILGNLENVNLGGEQVDASVLFVDIIGFTKLSQTMEPNKVNELLNQYFSYIAQAAQIYGGHVDKYIGDCAMLVFGVPKKDEHHSFQAVSCALLVQKIVSSINKERIKKELSPVNFHIAANSGLMLAGNMGSSQRMEYTVIGDSVNLASRIASQAQDNEILIPGTMLQRAGIKDNFLFEKKDDIQVRGHNKPVPLFRITCCTKNNQINLTKNMEKLINHDFSEK